MIILNEFDYKTMLLEMQSAEYTTLDIETAADHNDPLGNALTPIHGHVVSIQVKADDKPGWYIPVAHRDPESGELLDCNFANAAVDLKEVLETKKIICHNAKFEYKYFKWHYNIDLNLYSDTMIASYITNENQAHGLKELATKYLGVTQWKMNWKDSDDFSRIAIEELGPYGIKDVDHTWALWKLFEPAIDKHFHYVFHKCEIPAIKVFGDMELNGVHVDEERMIRVSQLVMKDLAQTTFKIHDMAGYKFNPKSADQRNKLLFEDLKIPYTYQSKELNDNEEWVEVTREFKRTPAGAYKSDKAILSAIADRHPIIPVLQEHSKLSTLFAAFVGYKNDPKTNRLHPSFNQIGTGTGRASSSGPNFQQVPGRDKYGIRKCFIAEGNKVFGDADYSAQELKVLTALTGDPTLLLIEREGLDPHGYVAVNLIFPEIIGHVNPNDVKKLHPDLRDKAKPVMFAIVYGAAADKIGEMIGKPKKEAQAVIDKFHKMFPHVSNLVTSTHEFVRHRGYSQNIDGRRRRFKYHNLPTSERKGIKSLWAKMQKERQEAVNFHIQGVSATMTKQALVLLRQMIIDSGLDIKIVATIHDEILCEYPPEISATANVMIETAMTKVDVCNFWNNIIPMKAGAQTAKSWGEAK
jgi:DNA polymerase-1